MKSLKKFLEAKTSLFFIIFIVITTFFLMYWLLIRPVRIKSFCHKKAVDLAIKNEIKKCKENLNRPSLNFIDKDPWCEKLSEKYGKIWLGYDEDELFYVKKDQEKQKFREKCFKKNTVENLEKSCQEIKDYDEKNYEKNYFYCLRENGLR